MSDWTQADRNAARRWPEQRADAIRRVTTGRTPSQVAAAIDDLMAGAVLDADELVHHGMYPTAERLIKLAAAAYREVTS